MMLQELCESAETSPPSVGVGGFFLSFWSSFAALSCMWNHVNMLVIIIKRKCAAHMCFPTTAIEFLSNQNISIRAQLDPQ